MTELLCCINRKKTQCEKSIVKIVFVSTNCGLFFSTFSHNGHLINQKWLRNECKKKRRRINKNTKIIRIKLDKRSH